MENFITSQEIIKYAEGNNLRHEVTYPNTFVGRGLFTNGAINRYSTDVFVAPYSIALETEPGVWYHWTSMEYDGWNHGLFFAERYNQNNGRSIRAFRTGFRMEKIITNFNENEASREANSLINNKHFTQMKKVNVIMQNPAYLIDADGVITNKEGIVVEPENGTVKLGRKEVKVEAIVKGGEWKDVAELKAKIADAKAKVSGIAKDLDAAEEELKAPADEKAAAKIQKNVEKLAAKKDKLEGELADLAEKVINATEHNKNVTEEAKETWKEQERKIAEEEKEAEKEKREAEKREAWVKSENERIANAEEIVKTTEAEIEKATTELEPLTAEEAELQAKLDEIVTKRKDLEKQIAFNAKQIEKAREIIETGVREYSGVSNDYVNKDSKLYATRLEAYNKLVVGDTVEFEHKRSGEVKRGTIKTKEDCTLTVLIDVPEDGKAYWKVPHGVTLVSNETPEGAKGENLPEDDAQAE